MDCTFPLLVFQDNIFISCDDACLVCVAVFVSTFKLFVHQVHFIYEQSILTSLAASGALVTMESRHHTLLPRKKIFFLIKSNPQHHCYPALLGVGRGVRCSHAQTGSRLILRHFGLLEVGRSGGGGLLFPSGLSHAIISSPNKMSLVQDLSMYCVMINLRIIFTLQKIKYWNVEFGRRLELYNRDLHNVFCAL